MKPKLIKSVSFAIAGLLALGGAVALAKAPSNVKDIHAASPVFKIGTYDLTPGGSAVTAYGGSASLVEQTSQYVLTLNGVNTGGAAYVDSTNYRTSSLTIIDIAKPIIIKVQGTNTISNTNATQPLVYGLFAKTDSSGVNLSIVGEGNNPTINFTSAQQTSGYSIALSSDVGSSSNINISNCTVNATAASSLYSYGVEALGSLNVGDGAKVNATSGGTSSGGGSNKAYGIYTNRYTQTAGEVSAIAGNATGQSYSYGLYVKSGNATISGGKLTANSGNTGGYSTAGLRIDNGKLLLSGGEFSAKSGTISSQVEGTSSFGVYLGNPSATNIVDVKSGLKLFYAHGKDRAVNGQILSEYLGYNDDAENIDSVANPQSFDATTLKYTMKKTLVFRKIQYSVTPTGTITYDEAYHTALTINVTAPATRKVEYSSDGGTTWSETNPTFKNVSETPCTVNWRITSKLYAPETGSAQLIINKADSSLTTAPTKVDDFIYDGDAHELVNAGTVDGGTLMYSLDGGEYVASLPSQTNAGSYEVSYKVVGDDNHKDIDPVSLGTVVISKADSVVTSAPEKVADFTADGESHALLTEGTVTGGTLKYSVNGGEFSATVPTAKDAGTYEISYRVDGDENHNDIAAVSLGSVTISVAPTPTPDPDTPDDPSDPVGPVNPSKNAGLPVWAIALIVVGGVLLLLCLLYILFMFVFNKWCIKDNKVVRAIKLREKQSRVKVILFPLCFTSRLDTAVFSSKAEAEKFLGK